MKSSNSTEKSKFIGARIPIRILESIKLVAKEEKRSFNSQLVVLLEKALREERVDEIEKRVSRIEETLSLEKKSTHHHSNLSSRSATG